MSDYIEIKGARVNNLKNVNVKIPRNKLVVIAGVSGSGKSSLAFDTLYAEGQRRYVESLSSYARQFLGRMNKPECDFIKGIPPAIAIEQRVISRNPRSTVGTTTEIYEYLRLLFARIGRTYSPISGQEVCKHSTEDIIACCRQYAAGTKFVIMAPIHLAEGRTMEQQLKLYVQNGYVRIFANGNIVRIDDFLADNSQFSIFNSQFYLVIDRLSVDDSKDSISRLVDSAETAFYEGNGELRLMVLPAGLTYDFSMHFEADGMTFEEPSDQLFSFNSPVGACPECQGFGKIIGIDEHLVIPNTALSVYDGCVVCWHGEKMGMWKEEFCRRAAQDDFPIFEPYYNLTQKQKDQLWHGLPSDKQSRHAQPLSWQDDVSEVSRYATEGRGQLRENWRAQYLRPRADAHRHAEAVVRPPGAYRTGTADWPSPASGNQFTPAVPARRRAGLPHAEPHVQHPVGRREPAHQPHHVARQLTRGQPLHPRRAEHRPALARYRPAYQGTETVARHRQYRCHRRTRRRNHALCRLSHRRRSRRRTLGWRNRLRGLDQIDVPPSHRPWNRKIIVRGARMNNLKGVTVEIPLNVMTVITGVSGSGKSSLVKGILYPALKRHLGEVCDAPGEYEGLDGDYTAIHHVEFIDQNPIGKSTRSNPATYVKAYDAIRDLFAEQPLAQQMGFSPQYFSFNADGGRCDECKGAGVITVEMQFMADLVLECEACHGHRFKRDILDVRFHGKNIDDVLNMTISEAIDFFAEHGQKVIVRRLQPLEDVGLGYIKLGQNSSTLSGGENQRVKLAYFIGQEKQEPTLFIFDEPTTGLHFHDIDRLLRAFNALIERGHTILIIEHNMEIIKCADHIIDMGPDGGDHGGEVVVTGTPEEVAACERSLTGKFLKAKL